MVRARSAAATVTALTCFMVSTGGAVFVPAMAQEDWKPFATPEQRRAPRAPAPAQQDGRPALAPLDGVAAGAGRRSGEGLPPHGGEQAAPRVERATAIERSELPPIQAADGSGLPSDTWRGLDATTFERLISELVLPPRSWALSKLWKRFVAGEIDAPAGADSAMRNLALRAEALHRSGLVAEEARLLAKAGTTSDSAVLQALLARSRVGRGERESGCEAVKSAIGQKAALPASLRADVVLLSGYCAAAAKNAAAAGLAAELVREEGLETSFGLVLLEAMAAGTKPKLPLPKQVDLITYKLLELSGGGDAAQLIERATPALLAVLATGGDSDPARRLAAAEAAARLNIVQPELLAEVWRAQSFAPAMLADPLSAKVEPAYRRALLFRAAESERTPLKKTRIIRALIDDARRVGLTLPTLGLIARQIDALAPAQEISWFAETAIEAQLAAGALVRARAWIAFAATNAGAGASDNLQHWLALADIADARFTGARGAGLGAVEALALRGRFSADNLHRLATVLDALDYQVPIRLWDAASRTPQPATGHLPATGVLSQLQDAPKKREFGRTVLMAMQALGPADGERAHIIALGDTIRALKQAGFEADARALGTEALLAGWPRSASN